MTTATVILPFREMVDGKLTIRFHDGQKRAWQSTKRFVAMLAGTKGGKTCFSPIWLEREIRTCGPGDYMVATSTFDVFRLALLPLFREHFEYDLGIARYWSGSKTFELAEELRPGAFWAKQADDKMWGRIILRSADAEAGLESAEFKAAVLDEADHPNFRRTAWEAIQRRLSRTQGRVLFISTVYQWDWLKTDIYDAWKDGDPDMDIIQFDSIENPTFPKAEYERAKRVMPVWKFNMFYRGMFERPAGIIYDQFDEDTCKIKRFNLDPSWPRYVGHDFGPNNMVAVWHAQNPATGHFFLYRTYHAGGMSGFDHAQKFMELSKAENILKRVGGSSTEDGWRGEFTAAGWPIQKPKESEVWVGINRVNGMHKDNRIFVFDDCHDYLREKITYSRELDKDYQPIENTIENKSAFHQMGAERYIMLDFKPEMAEPMVAKIRSYRRG